MAENLIGDFSRRLDLARNGGGILFCGAGYSAECLNFKPDETSGTGTQLLNLFNTELGQYPPFRDLQNAADALWEQIADHGMQTLLKDRFTVSDVTSEQVDLLRYPWQSVYTTNHDDALEVAARAAHIPVEVFNNTDDPDKFGKFGFVSDSGLASLPIVHLHGYVHKWDIHNIRESFRPGAERDPEHANTGKWLNRFRRDIDQAQIVVFVGFNSGDFNLNQVINDPAGLREKAFFINRSTVHVDPDLTVFQNRFGTPSFAGRTWLATGIKTLLERNAPNKPYLSGFVEYKPPVPATVAPAQTQIEDFFLYGKVDPSQLARDWSSDWSIDGFSDVSGYHIRRNIVQEALGAIANETRIVLLDGNPCSGKTLLTADLAYGLSRTRPVYRMRQVYKNVLNEVADILHHAPNAVLIIENCLDLPTQQLAGIASQFEKKEGVLILASRTVAVDANPAVIALLEGLESARRISPGRLDDSEMRDLSGLAGQIEGWRDFNALDHDARLRFIQKTCHASLSRFMTEFLQSDYVIDRYREEFNKVSLNHDERSVMIAALYFSYIGENASVSFLSNAMGMDCGAIIDTLNARAGNDPFRLIRKTGETGKMIETVPSVGAGKILQDLFTDADVVDAIIPLLKRFAAIDRDYFEQHVFTQLMRFTILSGVVTDHDEINRFFEHNKQESEIRRSPLFWLQWHMARCAAGEFVEAEKFLEQGYSEAGELERRTGRTFDRRQLDDRRARFLMVRAEQTGRSGKDLFRDFREAIELTDRILCMESPQYFPFETFAEIVRCYGVVGHEFYEGDSMFIDQSLDSLADRARKRIHALSFGSQRDRAQLALDRLENRDNSGNCDLSLGM